MASVKKELWWSRRKEDFNIDWFSGTGGGGQHRNKHPNCCRMTDKETGIMTTGQSQRSRQQNLKDAFHKMVELLKAHYESLETKEKIKRSSDNEQQTRTYHKEDNRVVDHITKKTYSYKHTIGKGNISQIVEDRMYYMINAEKDDE